MIKDPPLMRVNRDFRRPSREQISALTGLATGFVVDAMMGRGALGYYIKPLEAAGARITGCALTCHCGPDDNLGLLASLLVAKPGDVIVAATESFSQSAVTGDLVLGMAKNNGVIGFVTDGMVRDTQGIKQVGLPCFARGVTPNSPVKRGPGSVGHPVVIGDVRVASGDIVVADEDGVVIVPADAVDDVIARLPEIRESEKAMDEAVGQGLKKPAYLDDMAKDWD
jgi:4-hydroxy-4-methyl-2-oxoglutarate aldolase